MGGENLNTSNRNISVDILKAVAIFGVVFIHAGGLLNCKGLIFEMLRGLFRYCVPCFIVIWSYFLNKSYAKKIDSEKYKYLFKRLVDFFIVFISWSLIYFALEADWKHLTVTKIITTHFLGYGWSGQYYFIIIFQLLLLFPILKYVYSKKFLRYAVYISTIFLYIFYSYFYKLLPAFIGKMGDRPFFFWVVYVFIGIAAGDVVNKKISPLWLFTVLFIPLEFYLGGENGFLFNSPYVLLSVLLASVMISLCFISGTCNLTKAPTWLIGLLNYIGQRTLAIFVSNPLIILGFRFLFSQLGVKMECNVVLQIVLPFVSTCLVLLMCLVLEKVIIKLKLGKILL